MTLYFEVVMFITSTAFISDFSSVLLDIKDKNIISTKGVSSKTLNAAKLTHIFIYVFSLTLGLNMFSLIMSLRYGILFFVVFFLKIVLIDLLMIMLTAFIYFIILKFFDGEKLKDMINFVQIILAIGIVLMYQLIVRIFHIININGPYVAKW